MCILIFKLLEKSRIYLLGWVNTDFQADVHYNYLQGRIVSSVRDQCSPSTMLNFNK